MRFHIAPLIEQWAIPVVLTPPLPPPPPRLRSLLCVAVDMSSHVPFEWEIVSSEFQKAAVVVALLS